MLWKFPIPKPWPCRCLLPTQAFPGYLQSSSHLEGTGPGFGGATSKGCEFPLDFCKVVPDVPVPSLWL